MALIIRTLENSLVVLKWYGGNDKAHNMEMKRNVVKQQTISRCVSLISHLILF